MVDYFRDLWTSMTDWAIGIDFEWVELVTAGIILGVAIALAVLFAKVAFKRLLRLSIVGGANFDIKTAGALRIPITAFILLLGLYKENCFSIIKSRPPGDIVFYWMPEQVRHDGKGLSSFPRRRESSKIHRPEGTPYTRNTYSLPGSLSQSGG